MKSKVLIFIPAYNEEGCIADVIKDVQNHFIKNYSQEPLSSDLSEETSSDKSSLSNSYTYKILVVDDGSSDKTRETALKSGAAVISFPYNQGAGAAAQTGYLYAWKNNYDFAAQLDADGQHRAEDLKMILDRVTNDETDLAVGSRYLEIERKTDDSYQQPFFRKAGSIIFRKLLALTGGQHLTDVTSGMRATNSKVIEQFADVYDPDYAEIESLQRCLNIGFRVKEYQVTMLPRQAGTSKINTLASINYALKTFLILGVGALRKSRDKELYSKKQHLERGPVPTSIETASLTTKIQTKGGKK